jgi:hypothetical protein
MKTERHAFDLGDIVTVFNRTLGGKFVIEGLAAIVKIRPSENMYNVRFLNVKLACTQGKVIEPPRREFSRERVYFRYVDPIGQEDPESYLETLNETAQIRQ